MNTGEHAAVEEAHAADPHAGLEAAGKRSNAMKIIVGCVVGLLGAGFAAASWSGSLETHVQASVREMAIRQDINRRTEDCDKRLRSVESWRERSDESDRWIIRSLEAIGRKLDAPLSPPPALPIDGLKGTP